MKLFLLNKIIIIAVYSIFHQNSITIFLHMPHTCTALEFKRDHFSFQYMYNINSEKAKLGHNPILSKYIRKKS